MAEKRQSYEDLGIKETTLGSWVARARRAGGTGRWASWSARSSPGCVGVVLAGLGGGIEGAVVSELGEYPGRR